MIKYTKQITLTVDRKKITVEPGKTILEAALSAGLYIPNLCYHPGLKPTGSCRLCVVEIEGQRGLRPACVTPVAEGMVVTTDSDMLRETRKNLIWLMMTEHPGALDSSAQFKQVADFVGVKELLPGHVMEVAERPVTEDALFLRDMNKCILCGKCVQMCQDIRGVGAIGFVGRGIGTLVGTSYGADMMEAACRFCGACVDVCPTGAIVDKERCPTSPAEREKHLVPCRNTCPAQVNIPQYVGLIAQGRFQDALEVIRAKVPFPHTLGLVCDHPCEGACQRNSLHNPVSVRALKRFVAEHDTGRWREKLVIAPDTGKKVAVVGSGPAGLTAAWFLRKKGHAVTVFEALPKLGGMLRVGIPDYRLVSEVLDNEVKDILSIGVDAKTNTSVPSVESLFTQGYDAVFVAIGAAKGMPLGLPGEEDPRVIDGLAVLRQVSLGLPVDIKGRVAVIGGGNVAMDVARTALRTGADSVTIVYRRTREEMPAYEEEIEDAIEEGVEIMYLTNPVRILPQDDTLALECVRMELGEPDASGRRSPKPKPGSEFILEVDRFLIAIGQQTVLPDTFGVAVNRKGLIQVDIESQSCEREGLFAGGDVHTGPASVIKAIAAGRRAASAIDKYLGGDGDITDEYVPQEEDSPYLGRVEGFACQPREEYTKLDPEERKHDFVQVEHVFDADTARKEASRCLRCQLRLQIQPAPMPPSPASVV